MALVALVDPRTTVGFDDFASHAPRPALVDDAHASVRASFCADNYQLLLVAPDGTLPDLRRDWVLPGDEAELRRTILDLLASTPTPEGDVVEASDLSEPPDAVARPDTFGPSDAFAPTDAGGEEVAFGDTEGGQDADAASEVDAGPQALPDFALPDRNPRSPWFKQATGPEALRDAVWFLYFPSPT